MTWVPVAQVLKLSKSASKLSSLIRLEIAYIQTHHCSANILAHPFKIFLSGLHTDGQYLLKIASLAPKTDENCYFF